MAEAAARDVFLVIYPENGKKPVPAHWAFFVPVKNGALDGQLIHAVGSPFTGYKLDIKEYDLSKTQKKHEVVKLGSVEEKNLPQLDVKAHATPVPGPSETPLDPFAGGNCQTFLTDFVELLVKDGLIAPSTLDVLKHARRV